MNYLQGDPVGRSSTKLIDDPKEPLDDHSPLLDYIQGKGIQGEFSSEEFNKLVKKVSKDPEGGFDGNIRFPNT